MKNSRLLFTLTNLLLLKEMQIVSTCTKVKSHSMAWHRWHGGVGGGYSCSFTRSERGGQCQAPAALRPRNCPGTHGTGGLVGPRTGLDGCEKSKQAYVYYDSHNFNLVFIRI